MKFTHYDYQIKYFLLNDSKSNSYKATRDTTSHRSQISFDYKYHTSWINISTPAPDIKGFDLGVDLAHPNFKLKDRCIQRLFLNFVIKGNGFINGEPFSAGQFYYTLPDEIHTIEADSDNPFVSVWMSIKGNYVQQIVEELNKKSEHKFMSIEYRNDVLELTKTLLYNTNLGEMSTSYLKSLINIYLSYIKASDYDERPEVFATEKIAKLVKDSKAYVRKNLKNVTVADMAADQHYNTKYFSRVFSEAMGMKPIEYITDCKMEWAKNSLTHSQLSITEITEAIGYDHRNGFAIAFKKKYGCTPSEYRKKTKK